MAYIYAQHLHSSTNANTKANLQFRVSRGRPTIGSNLKIKKVDGDRTDPLQTPHKIICINQETRRDGRGARASSIQPLNNEGKTNSVGISNSARL